MLPTLPQLDDSVAPGVQDEVAVTGEIAAPQLPTPGTPGYRPPPLPLPTLSAAVRAGIVAADPKTPSAEPPPAPLSLGSTAPLDTAQ